MDLMELVARVEAAEGTNNALDVLIEVALFQPDGEFVAARPNSAGTKVIFTRPDGSEATFWSEDWTLDDDRKFDTVNALKAIAQTKGEG